MTGKFYVGDEMKTRMHEMTRRIMLSNNLIWERGELRLFRGLCMTFLLLFLNKFSPAQTSLYHHPESDFLDTCVFPALQEAKIITHTLINPEVIFTDTLSKYDSQSDKIDFYKDKDSISIKIKKDSIYTDYLTINISNDTIVCRFPLSEMKFLMRKNEYQRIYDNTMYTLFGTSSFLEFLDFDKIEYSELGVFQRKDKIQFSNVNGREGTEKYTVRNSIKSEDEQLITPYIGDIQDENCLVKRLDIKNGFFDQLKCVYYLYANDLLIYKIRIWKRGPISILHFEY